jgi:hypothetical protein
MLYTSIWTLMSGSVKVAQPSPSTATSSDRACRADFGGRHKAKRQYADSVQQTKNLEYQSPICYDKEGHSDVTERSAKTALTQARPQSTQKEPAQRRVSRNSVVAVARTKR